MTTRRGFNIAPRVVVFPFSAAPPSVGEGSVALPVLESAQPRAVFGDGSHPTTRLCAAAVDLMCRQRPWLAVLDVGTGTGILARIARARGASFVVGTDIDPIAVACAKAHAALDGCGAAATGPAGRPGAGMLDGTILFADSPPDHWGARFDLIVANILEAPLLSLAPALCRALRPGGVLLISGFTRPQTPALRRAYEAAGVTSVGGFALEEWALLKFFAPHGPSKAKVA